MSNLPFSVRLLNFLQSAYFGPPLFFAAIVVVLFWMFG